MPTKSKIYYRLQAPASLLPQWLLSRLARRFDTPGHFECSVEEGHSFWMDSSYYKWCRTDRRREKIRKLGWRS